MKSQMYMHEIINVTCNQVKLVYNTLQNSERNEHTTIQTCKDSDNI